MRLKTFRFNNLFSLGKGEVNLNHDGILLVRGHSEDEGSSNGAGKSSVANKGIIWTLYGQTAGGIKGDAVINRHGNKKSANGELQFEQDGKVYRVVRKRPTSLSLFVLTDDKWKDISEKKSPETQKKIDKLLGLDFQAFVQTHLFGQGRMMSYPSLTPAQQKAVLSQLLPVEHVREWEQYTKEKIKELKPKLAEAERTFVQAEAKSHTLQEQIEVNQDRIDRWKMEHGKNIRELKAKLDEEDQRVKGVWLDIAGIEGQITRLQEEMLDEETQNQMAFQAASLHNEIERYKASIFTARTNGAAWIAKARQHLQAIQDIDNGNCPTCQKPMTDEELVAHITTANEENRLQSLEAEKMHRECENSEKGFDQLVREKSAEYSQLQEALDQARDAHTKIRRYYDMKQSIEAKLEDQTPFLTAALNQTLNEECPYLQTLEELREEKEAHDKQILETASRKFKTLEDELKHLEYWKYVYSDDLQRRLFERACPFLTERTATYLSALGNSQLYVQFSTIKVLASGDTRDDFNVHVYSQSGGDGFDNLSGGEQQIVSFAVGLALGDLSLQSRGGASLGFQILDEPFTMLDERNAENIVDFLTRQARISVLISNEDKLASLVPQVIDVRKRQGVTEVI